jgi:CIC family chloride channel protein
MVERSPTDPAGPRATIVRRSRFIAALVSTSLLAASFAIAARWAMASATHALFGSSRIVEAFTSLPQGVRLAAPMVGALAGAALAKLGARLPESRGVGDVMEAVVLGRGRVSIRAALVKAGASFLALVGGGSVGREGPLIQVGAAIGGRAGEAAGLDGLSTRVLYAAGTAAGFAAAYNTPIAATLFVLEVVVGVVALELVVPVALAAGIATAVSRWVFGDAPVYGIRTYALVSTEQLAASVLLGPLAALVGVGFMVLLGSAEKAFARTSIAQPWRAALGGAGVGALAMFLPEIVGNGADTIDEMLDGRVLGLAFFVLLVAKMFATASSVSSGSAGGVFTPSMFIGAALGGGLASIWLGGAGADRVPVVGAFALVGMASAVSATTHAPLMAAALAFEMSGDYALVVPLLLATALATLTARSLRPDSIYAAELRRRGVDWDRSLSRQLSSGP